MCGGTLPKEGGSSPSYALPCPRSHGWVRSSRAGTCLAAWCCRGTSSLSWVLSVVTVVNEMLSAGVAFSLLENLRANPDFIWAQLELGLLLYQGLKSGEQRRGLKAPLAFPMSSLRPVSDFHFSPGISFRTQAIRAVFWEIFWKKQKFCVKWERQSLRNFHQWGCWCTFWLLQSETVLPFCNFNGNVTYILIMWKKKRSNRKILFKLRGEIPFQKEALKIFSFLGFFWLE